MSAAAKATQATPIKRASKTAASKKVEPVVTIEEWSPEHAAAALGHNRVNRNIRDGKVIQYGRDMREGRWSFCPDPITFNVKGDLINGQHRLTAQINEEITTTWVVMRGAPEATQATMDTGAGRSLHDLLKVKGSTQVRAVGAVARLALQMETGRIFRQNRDRTASNTEILDFFEKNPSIEHSALLSTHVTKTGMLNTIPSALGAAHWWIAQHVGVEEADEFLYRLSMTRAVAEREGSPIIALVKRLNGLKQKQVRVEPRWLIFMILKCWNYDVAGAKVYKIMSTTRDGEYRLVTPLKPGADYNLTEDEVVMDDLEDHG